MERLQSQKSKVASISATGTTSTSNRSTSPICSPPALPQVP
ncbi:hypothetical protein E2C01_042863 [Portunus trituberculatus]|uniref:Uncharacterized protein n=1 Tax=Portunus trituberculatus TaxID=210409 RepID=A0A5B7FRC4_PORTR|nr:hypothetical protein [Portunus trituberculatus]